MTTKNESLWLASGIAGENQARALNQAIEFTRVEVGNANDARPPMDSAVTALVNKVADGTLISHKQDPNDAAQRIVEMQIEPNDNYNAWELILYAKYGNTEFAHTYFRLAEAFPVRTVANGGSQAKLRYTIRVSQSSSFSVFVSPNLSYLTEAAFAENLLVLLAPDKLQAGREHIIYDSEIYPLPDAALFQGGEKVRVKTGANTPVIKGANNETIKRIADGATDTSVTIVEADSQWHTFVYNKTTNQWEF